MSMPQFPSRFPLLPQRPDVSKLPDVSKHHTLSESPEFPPLPAVPRGSKAKSWTNSPVGKSSAAQLSGDGVKHARERSGSKTGLADHRRFPHQRAVVTPKMRLIETPKSPQAPVNRDNKFFSDARASCKNTPKIASLPITPGASPKLNAFSNFRTDFGTSPRKVRKPINPRTLEKGRAKQAAVEKIKPFSDRLAQLSLPASRLNEEKLQNEEIRKKLVLFELRKPFENYLPVVGARFDEQGRVCAIQVQKKYFKSSKWIAIEWKNDAPILKEKITRLRDVTPKLLKTKLDVIAETVAVYDKAVKLDPNANRNLCLQRAIKAVEMASALLPDLPKDAGSTLLRRGFQGIRYTIPNPVGFKNAYAACQLPTYFESEGMKGDVLAAYVDALLVEAFQDLRQVVAGCVSPQQIIELIKLFPENPPKTDERDWAEVDEGNKKLIQSKLKEILGDYHQLVGGLFRLVSAFQELAVSVLEEESLVGLAKNFWRTNMLLFGLASQQMDIAYGENGTPEAQEFGRRKLMWAFHLSNNAADFFELDA